MNTPAGSTGTPPARASIDVGRYRAVLWLFARIIFHLLWWDIFLNRPVLRWLRAPAAPRWRRLATHYRALAVEMGGVLIKLGQFLSARVDLLPAEVTRELAGLQDEVPPVPFEAITAEIAADFGRPAAEVFPWICERPVGAASLAQAHLARLPDGREVVVKVLRPGVEVLVETDLAALRLALRWLAPFRLVRQRVDLNWLADEFVDTTRAELDMAAEARNAQRFAEDFAGHPDILIPAVYLEHSAARTLTLENVGFLKIADLEALEAAGVDRAAVARRLYRAYMEQIFVHNFVHADPHPGNLFIRPLPVPGEDPDGPGFAPGDGPPPYRPHRPFQIAFVDFGMVAVIPARLRSALREYIIGLARRDARGIVASYVSAGILRPGADTRRLEEAHEAILERFWGVEVGKLGELALSEARALWREYRDVLLETPIQVQADLLFTGRAVELLAGMATRLDPAFNPWAETVPFAERLAAEEAARSWPELARLVAEQARVATRLPSALERFLTTAERGTLTVESALSANARRAVERLERSVQRLVWVVAGGALLLAGAMLETIASPAAPWLLALAIPALLRGLLRR